MSIKDYNAGPAAALLVLLAGATQCAQRPQTPTGVRVLAPTRLSPGDDLAFAVSSAAPGTAFVLRPGVYRRQSINPKDGMSFTGEPGAILDGENVTGYAFETLASIPKGVEIRGLVIERYAPALNLGAIQADNGADWIVEDNEIRFNANIGLKVGARMRVRRNHIHHNGVSGIAGYRSDGVLIENNEIAFNNPSNTFVAPALAGESGVKLFEVNDLIVRGNRVHQNNGLGIWCDNACLNALIEDNTVTLNTLGGIWQEAGYSAVIRQNVVTQNGLAPPAPDWVQKAGIMVSNSPNVEVYGNTVAGNANGITAMYASGYGTTGPHGPRVLANLFVHDNTVTMETGRSGLAQNMGDLSVFTSRNNRWERNVYEFGVQNLLPFMWMNRPVSREGWQSYDLDVAGAFR